MADRMLHVCRPGVSVDQRRAQRRFGISGKCITDNDITLFCFWIGAIGAGDVKMLGVCAGFFPWNKVLYFLFFALMIAAVIALFKMYLERNMKDRLYYLGEYLWDVFRCGRWKLYFAGEREGAGAGICMAGPVFCSALMYMGGMY